MNCANTLRCACIGSYALHHWQTLATPDLGRALGPRPGIQTRGEGRVDWFEPDPYSLSDLEEDGMSPSSGFLAKRQIHCINPLTLESNSSDDASNFDILVYFWCINFMFAALNAPPAGGHSGQ